MTPSERLGVIVKAMRFCDEVVTRENLRLQYRYETGQNPESRDLDTVLRKLAKEVER